MMTGNQFRDLLPTSVRLLLRSPLRLPWQLFIPWLVMVALIFVIGWKIIDLALDGTLKKFGVNDVIEAVFPDVRIAAAVALAVFALIGWLTSSFVDVVRYLDTSPRSYDVRRAIRKGMVDLLTNLHADDKYSRIIVVAHSLGGYIAYDGLTALWDETDRKKDDPKIEFTKMIDLQATAQALVDGPPADSGGDHQKANLAEDDYGPKNPEIIAFRNAQFELWKQLRTEKVNWRITDLITLGTPMYLANVLMTKCDRQFNDLRKRSELPQCPPRSDSETVEGKTPEKLMYGRRESGQIKRRLVTGSPFAVVRWSNYWFTPVLGVFGDPFGGSLDKLFGAGVDNRPVTVKRVGRYIPLWAHTRYFKYPDLTGPKHVAPSSAPPSHSTCRRDDGRRRHGYRVDLRPPVGHGTARLLVFSGGTAVFSPTVRSSTPSRPGTAIRTSTAVKSVLNRPGAWHRYWGVEGDLVVLSQTGPPRPEDSGSPGSPRPGDLRRRQEGQVHAVCEGPR